MNGIVRPNCGAAHLRASRLLSSASCINDGDGLWAIKSMKGGMTTVSVYSSDSVIVEYDNETELSSSSREYI
jgi:hypothetical protein